MTRSDILLPRCRDILSDRRPEIVIALVVTLIVYGGFVFVPGLHIDDEVSAVYRNTITGNIGLGRWGTSLFRELAIPEPFNGYFTTLFSVATFSLAGIAFSSYLFNAAGARRMALVLFIAFPQFCYQIEFHVQADVVPVAYLASIMSFVALYDRSRHAVRGGRHRVIAVLLILFSMSVYQPIALFAICMGLCVSIEMFLAGHPAKAALKPILGIAAVVAAALPIYVLVSSLLMHVPGVVDGRSYFSNQFLWNKQSLHATIRAVSRVLAGVPWSRTYYGEDLYCIAVIPLLGILLLAVRSGWRTAMFVTPLAIALACLPYTIVIVMGATQPARTFIVQGGCLSALWGSGLTLVPFLARRSGSMLMLTGLGMGVAAFDASRLAFADFIQWQADCSTGVRIIQDIYRVDPSFDEASQAVLFYGAYRRPNFWRAPNYDMFGRSFFAWDNGSPDRIATFLTVTGIANIHAPAAQERPALAQKARTTPVWPRPGSIRVVGNSVIVRLGA